MTVIENAKSQITTTSNQAYDKANSISVENKSTTIMIIVFSIWGFFGLFAAYFAWTCNGYMDTWARILYTLLAFALSLFYLIGYAFLGMRGQC